MQSAPDPERNTKKTGLSFGIVMKLRRWVRNLPKVKQRTPEEIEAELLATATQNRETRIASFGPIQRYIFGRAAKHYNIDVDEIIEGVADSDKDTEILNSFCTKNGHSVIVFLNRKLQCPGKETGRYDPDRENFDMMRVTCTDGLNQNHEGPCAAICRSQTDNDLDMKTIMEEITVEEISVEEGDTLKAAIERLQSDLNLAANVQLRKEKAPPSDGQKTTIRIEYDLEHITDFEVSHNLFKGHLLVPFQIEETSRKRELVDEVKIHFDRWLQQIRIILIQDTQITKNSNNVGPRDELKYWQKRVDRYKRISEFITSRAFVNHLRCLQYTKAKLLKKWNAIEAEFKRLVLESENNVNTLKWLQPYWETLYTCTPTENIAPIKRLMAALRDVYNDSANYNKPECVTSFLVKTTNQLVITCRSYLDNNGTLEVLKQEPCVIVEQISNCEKLIKQYEESYTEVFDEANEKNAAPWTCSTTYIFGISNKFKDRLQKIRTIIDTKVTYSVLDKIKISGMERYRNQIVSEFNEIAEKPYSPLNNWVKKFDSDYIKWNKATEAAEIGMQKFVKQSMAPIQNTSAMLLFLKRFERLKLECLCLDRRYLDVAVVLEKEMDQIKDAYNERRDNPPLMKGTPPVYGRILWIRGIQRRIDEVINAIKDKPCVVKHPKAQIAVKCYNYMTEMCLKYEQQQYTAWFNFIEDTRKRLGQCVLRRNPNTHMMEVNFHSSVYEMIREGEGMSKLGLDVPNLVQTVSFYRDVLLNAVETLKQFIKRNNELRLTIDNVYIRISRQVFRKLDIVFKEGLQTVQWDSKDLATYFAKVDQALTEVTDFFKSINEIKRWGVEAPFHFISKATLVTIPDDPVPTDHLYSLNHAYRYKMDKVIEAKSAMAELATVKIINKFVDMIDVKHTDENGQTVLQLPTSQHTEANYRDELRKPIDKYDWMSFQKIGRQVLFPESERFTYLFKVSKDSKFTYGLLDLHNDCMDIFSYFFWRCVDAMAASCRTSLELLKKKMQTNDSPITLTEMKLDIPVCVVNPTIEELQKSYEFTLKNIVETFVGVNSWGMLAQTAERKKQKKLADEVNRERSFYKYIWEHKHIERTMQTQSLSLGMILLQPDMKQLLNKTYRKYSHLWAVDRMEIIEKFVNSNPLTVDIRDKFIFYDYETSEIVNAEKHIVVGAILVNAEPAYDSFLELSKERKAEVGRRLSDACNQKVITMVQFISDQQVVLSGSLKDLDDVRLAMKCLDAIKEESIEIDMLINTMEETYRVFDEFSIEVPNEIKNSIVELREKFDAMMATSKTVTNKIYRLEKPLLKQLNDGKEAFKKELDKFEDDFAKSGPMVKGISAAEASKRVFQFDESFQNLWIRFDTYATGEKLFGLPITDYPILHQRKKEFVLLLKLYSLYLSVLETINGYNDVKWSDIDIEIIGSEIMDYQLRCRSLPKGMQNWNAYIDLNKKIDDFNELCPLLELMTKDAMKERHWNALQELMSYEFNIDDPNTKLGYVLAAPLLKYKDDVYDICLGADKETEIETKLKQVIASWSSVDIQMAPFKNRGDLLLKGAEMLEIVSALEDSIMVMNSLDGNRYNKPFKHDVKTWLKKLRDTSEVLEKWLSVQNLWMYLEAVFVGGDIAVALPEEAQRFAEVDKKFEDLTIRARKIQNVVEICSGDDTMLTAIPNLILELESCQKSLTGYLESKRLIFPRFFFVSDPVLLEIFGQASDPTTIQPHLLSIFDAVATVTFAPKSRHQIIGINSANKEHIKLETVVNCTDGVEIWLGRLLEEMKNTMQEVLAKIAGELSDPEFNFIKDFQDFCGQAGLIGVQILWTNAAELAIKKSKVDKGIMQKTNQQFLDLLNEFIELTLTDLTKLQRIKYETMVTIHVHQRDIFDELVRLRVKQVNDFEWQKQARFYFDRETEDIAVGITDVDFIYQNEYLGVVERLAITPLTDRCYISLAQAVGMCLGGAPAGPAGTGKTETTKDMGRALGKFVVVFNCSDQMDFRGLGRIFKGLAQSGSWGCFDEFNRIELPVLSVAAQQINIVLNAKKERKRNFVFSDGDVVSMDREFGIFITMNPGYAGRQELPENLKILFRTVAMMVPDRQIIIRVKLASCGFKENVILARKFYTLYKLCEEQLSKQVHYDFGLRNTISVLRTLGTQKRANPRDTEEKIVMRVLRDMNLSKLIDEDAPLFLSLIDDLFPGNKLSSSSYKELQSAIEKSAQGLNLMNEKDWNLKVVQLYETSLVRHGIMTLGPTGSGKTAAITTLLRSFKDLGQPHKEVRMNPKAITAAQMFGRLDVATNDWMDGIFSTLWRRTHKVKKTEFMWLVLDGPVDAVWIENLNSVLDDNKTLTLANGDRIVMAENCKLVFEPDNVDNASPATVSRVGIIYLSSSVLRWMSILDTWLKGRTPQEAQTLKTCFYQIYEDALVFVCAKLFPKMIVLEAIYIRQTIDILNGLLTTTKTAKTAHLEKLFIFALMWSLGALLELHDRLQLETFIATHKSKFDLPKRTENDTIFEYFVAPTGEWRHWALQVDEFIYPDDSIIEYASILVPNIDNIRTAYLIKLVADQRKPVLLIGEQGTAKTVMIKKFMATYNAEEHLTKTCNFSSATTPNMFQQIIESYVEKRVGLTFGPPGQRKMTVFVDDVNMPVINEWGDQITNEIFRQLIEQKGFYSLERPGDFMTVMDLQFLAAMIHPGGGRNDIPNRLKRKFCIFNCTMPSDNSMDKIFSAIARGYFSYSRFSENIVYFVPKLIELTRILWQRTKTKMLPTPAKFHYVFNLRDLSRIWEGILKVRQQECETIETMLKLWRHECLRTIADRFISSNEKKWFDTMMADLVQEHLESNVEQYDDAETYFVDFLRDVPEMTGAEGDDALETPKIYEEMPSFDFVKEKVISLMKTFNELNRGLQLDLVFFHDCLVHLIIISRIIRTPRGNALLVGVGGSGKQSLTRLASFIAGYKFHQITLTRSYNVNNFADDLKYLYRTAGVEGKGISFIFTDNDIKDDAFLEYINNVLSSGELPNLFTKEETDEIINELDPVLRKQDPKSTRTRDSLYDFFIQRCRSNLHVVLCFSPIGQKFRNRSLKFPGLISGCTMDWFQPWPEDARIAVSHHYLADYPMECEAGARDEVIKAMSFVHQNVSETCEEYYRRFRRQIFVTPKTLLAHLDSYKAMYVEKYENIQMLSKRMENGLVKLEEGGVAVKVLKTELVEQNKKMIVASEQATLVYAEVKVVADDAELVKTEVAKVKFGAQAIVKQITLDTTIVEKKLAKARPALEEAQAALNTITSTDIATVRRLGKPPYLITLIMDAVLILFGDPIGPVKPDPATKFLTPSWSDSMKTMSDTGFLNNIVKYPTDEMTDEMVDLLVPYFNNKLYTFEAAEAACGNVAGLLKWTIAMTKYFAVNKDVIPVKYKMAIQQHKLKSAEEDLRKAEELLAEKEKVLAEAMKVMKVENDKKDAVFAVAQKCQDKMNSATALIDGLSSEKTRWIDQIAQFKTTVDCLVGDVLYLTAFLSYIGPFNQDYRKRLLETWRDYMYGKRIPMSSKINVIESLCDMATVGEWNVQGLPKDELSIQNGVVVAKASRYPLIIDPQCQGKVWIANMEREAGLIITTLNDRFFRNHIEDCVSLGKPLLIEDVGEELDTCLDNILEKNFIRLGKTLKVKLSDKEIEYNPDFRLYITTKLANPVYSPEICARTSLIDFAVTMQGLEDQLLGRVIMHDKRELEEERTNIIITMSTNRRKIQQLEENLLKQLSMSTGNLLDDIPFINTLNASKATANDMKEKLITAKETEFEINAAREDFRVVATRGSVLYFLVCAMAEVNVMYQTSLNQFLERFDVSLSQSKKSHNNKIRIANIIDYLTFEIFSYKSRGLFESHKFLFALLLALKIDMQKGDVSYEEFQTFIKGGAALNLKDCPKKPYPWITDMTWLNLVQLTVLRPFVNVLKRIGENENPWKRWFQKPQPENAAIPDEYQKQLDVFRKLLLIRAWCPDRTYSQSRKYIAWSLGERFVEPLILNYNLMVNESKPLTPLICFLSMGSDPTLNIQSMAKKYDTTVKAISMGQGQEVHARALLSTCLLNGGWTLLQNCHLGLDYMHELVIRLKSLETDEDIQIHDKFRLWITTEVHPQFPITLLQQSIKFTNDPPSGVRAGLERTYGTMSQDFLDYSDSPYYLPLIYAVSFMHTVVQERRKFGPLGWNIPYEFNSSDWLASCMFMQNHLDEIYPKREICWNTIRYMLGEIQYGGRVTDDFDKRLLNTFAKVWFSSKMFTDDFQFCADIPKYKIHNFKLQEEYLQAFSEMETVDQPQVYGLHPNGDIAYQTNTTNTVLDTILSIEPKDSSGSVGESREGLVARIANDMLEKLPATYDPFEMREKLREMGLLNPMVIFLRQELDRMRVVLHFTRNTLSELLLAIEGTIIMNEELQNAFDSIFDAKVPRTWLRKSWVSSTLGFWFTELIDRNKQFSLWLYKARPRTFCMSGFFNPQGFLTAVRQETTRANVDWALDEVTLQNEVTKMFESECKIPPKTGVYVHGLYLDGGSWDLKKGVLTEAVNKVLYKMIPVVNIFALNAVVPLTSTMYECPVYKIVKRTDLNFITSLRLKSDKPASLWIQRGVALLCDIK